MRTIIYIRTSTEDQNPKNQLDDCKSINKYGEYLIFEEKQSAYKDKERERFAEIIKLIKQRKIDHLICWDLDRLYRNRKKLIQFFQLCKIYKCTVHSFMQEWLNELSQIPDPFNEIVFDLMIQVMGWIAEEESTKKSGRVKASISNKKNKDGRTISKYGKVWGKKPVPIAVQKQIVELRKQGKKLRAICKEVYYWDANRNKHYVSLGFVHKVLAEIPQKIS